MLFRSIFGEDDNFINMFAGLISKLPVVPVFGPSSPFQPVHVDDAAQAVGNVLAAPASFAGKTYELGGPEVITMGDLNRRIGKAAQRTPLFLDLPDAASSAFASATGWLPGAPLSRNQWTLLKAGNTANPALPGMAELGVLPRPLELFLDRWMVRYRKHGRFAAKAA